MAGRLSVVRVGVDTGGTFTDLVLLEAPGPLKVAKVLSTPDDPSRAVMEGLTKLGVLKGNSKIIHGTTVATNAFLQRRGGRTALVTTAGFEDVLVIGRQARGQLYRLDPPPRKDWIPKRLRLGISERQGPNGEVWQPLRKGALSELRRRLRRLRPDAVAVCLLHSYSDSAHEEQVGRALQNERWDISLSHQIANEFREYERTCTTVANATLMAPLKGYLSRLGDRIGPRRLRVMASSGGWIGSSRAAAEPVRTILSGPAGGALAAAKLGLVAGAPRLITLDMGGTSTDIALCDRGVTRVHGVELDGLPIRIPCLDIQSVGAGGGSIARLDPGGALRVGPESAGANPGPACYGKGGREPTLTDAHLLLGRLAPEGLLGGTVPLQRREAERAMDRLASKARLTRAQASLGVVRVAEASLERAVRSISAGRGRHPARFALLAFGGAGGLHACGLARSLGLNQVLIPSNPGAFSAWGLCGSAATAELSRTILIRATRFQAREVDRLLAPLKKKARGQLLKEGHTDRELRYACEADLRYVGQSHELTLSLTSRLAAAFHRAHQEEFGYHRPGDEVELVTLRVRVSGPEPKTVWPRVSRREGVPRPESWNEAILDSGHRQKIPVYRRESLGPGQRLAGPCLVVEYSATTWIPHDFSLHVDKLGNLVVENLSEGRP